MQTTGEKAPRPIATLAHNIWVLGFLVWLGGCKAAPAPQLTGHQGGLLPGMVLPQTTKPKAVAQGYSGTNDQVLPDGQILRRSIFNGMVVSQMWLSSLGLPERQVFYQSGNTPSAEIIFGPDGKPTRQITYFSGSNQPSRVDEYAAGGSQIVRFTEYWRNGQPRIVSEADVSTPSGVVNRIQQWYENGRPKSLVQQSIERDETGRTVGEYLQGRQKQWSEDGTLIADSEYEHDRLQHDYLVEARHFTP